MSFPNRHLLPLTRSEQMAEQFAGTPGRLFELADSTGNRALASLAIQLMRAKREKQRRAGQGNKPRLEKTRK
jgi:hypothetical protein